MEQDILALRERITRLESFSDDRSMICEGAAVFEDHKLPGLRRKLQQAEKELAELVLKQIIPPGMGDEASEDQAPASDAASKGWAALVRARAIQKLRPDLKSRNPELGAEELAEAYEAET